MNPGGIAPMPTVGGSAAGIAGDVSSLAPLAQGWSGAYTGVNINQTVTSSPTYGGGQSNLGKFAGFIGHVATDVGHLGMMAGNWAVHTAETMASAPIKFGYNAFVRLPDAAIQNLNNNVEVNQNIAAIQSLNQRYGAGLISSVQYKAGLQDLTAQQAQISKYITTTQNMINTVSKTNVTAGLNTVSDILAIATGGIGSATLDMGTKTAADYLVSTNANAFLSAVETGVSKLASDPIAFARLSPGAQAAIDGSTADVISQAGAHMGAAQITRAVATQVAIKYPLTFSVINPNGEQIYQELQKGQYGKAVNTLAFNASLLLAGGVVGEALKYGGKALSALKYATFGQTSFIDELSKLIGDGNASGIHQFINGMADKTLQKTYVDNLSAVAATNMAATGGDAIAAAKRVADGMASYEGVTLDTFTHAEAVTNMNEFAKWQRFADTTAKEHGLPTTVLGRLDARNLTTIRQGITSAPDVPSRLQAWENIKLQNSNQAYANNTNFDKQIKYLINNNPDGGVLAGKIQAIKAGVAIDGFPAEANASIAKAGYIPVSPNVVEAPFKEGSGKLLTSFADSSNKFFVKAVKPLPVLNVVGGLMTRAGLSPEASIQQSYKLFNDNLASRLGSLDVTQKIADRMSAENVAKATKTVASAPVETFGLSKDELAFAQKAGITPEMLNSGAVKEGQTAATALTSAVNHVISDAPVPIATKSQATDYMLKQLKDFAATPTRGGIKVGDTALRAPITDLRQLTNKDIQKALGISSSEARAVSGALNQSMLDVNLGVRGLGDKIMDYNYKFNPVAKGYARIQGATRYAWNPIYHAKVDFKTELLSQASAGGKVPTLPGTNAILGMIFPEYYGKLDSVISMMKEKGILSQEAHTLNSFGGGQGFTDVGAYSASLTHTLSASQERSIASMVSMQADKAGVDVSKFVDNNPQQVSDTVQSIIGYDRNNSFLNSPLTRTLNYAFFPFRFELKVASIMTKALSNSSLLTKMAVVKGLYAGHNWLNSPAGQAWYIQNQPVIGLFNYFTPTAELNNVFNALGKLPGSVGQLGELGGLPFGFIPQLLDSAGLTHFNQSSYVNAQGVINNQYVPVNMHGQLTTAVEDLLNNIFTYPGATMGLPSKASITYNVAKGLTVGKSTDTQTIAAPESSLTPSQKSFQATAQKLAGTTTAPPVQQPAQQQNASTIAMPTQPTTATTPLPKSTSAPKLKKSQEPVQLLPGQTQEGVIPGAS